MGLWDFASEHISQEDFLKCCNVVVGKLTKEIAARSGMSLKAVEHELGKYAVRSEIRETGEMTMMCRQHGAAAKFGELTGWRRVLCFESRTESGRLGST